MPVAATPKPFARTLSATEGVSPRTQQLSIRRSTSVPIVSSIGFNSPTPGKHDICSMHAGLFFDSSV